MNDDKRLACARLSYSKVGTYWNEQSENKACATWEMGRWRRGKWEREPCLSPAPARLFAFLFTPFDCLDWTTFHHYPGSLEQAIICTNQFHLLENCREGLETGIKDGFEEMQHEFLFVIFHPEKQDHLSRCSFAPGNFLLGRPKKSCSIYFPTGFPGKFLQMVVVNHLQNFSSPRSLIPPLPSPFLWEESYFY